MYVSLILLVFALVFACIEAWRGSSSARPANFGWLALALLIAVELLSRSLSVLK